ncbi:MAG: peptide chain release factor N(5)-glutamine methyltransferase [Clostridia bacterium]|nr:peptide chain release factor N(5)-glutamine methyltransferase [Clostridia bacterium]
MKNKKKKIGGMALFNGLLLKSTDRECMVQENDVITIKSIATNHKFSLTDIPIIRGIARIISTIQSSVPYIMKSAREIINDITKNEEEEIEVNNYQITIGYVIAILLLISLYIVVPNVISLLFASSLQSIIQVLLQVITFGIYLLVLKSTRMFNTLFEYHGAEHKVVNAYEALGNYDLEVAKVKKCSRFHRRCGGNFVIYFVIGLLLTTLFIPSSSIWLKTVIQMLLTPVILGVAYETLFLFSMLPKPLAFLSYPAMAIQFITTREPSDDKIKIAITALKGCLASNKKITLKEYINHYITKNLNNIPYEMSDILRIVGFYKNTTKDEIYTKLDEISIDLKDSILLDKLFDKLYKENIPLQYILQKQSFYNEEYFVNENVLIPRQDSEILVEKAIQYINNENLITMIDMCTGSGCIGISITKHTALKITFLVDISKKTLEVAEKNISINQIADRVKTIHSDLFDKFLNKTENTYDIIVSNPPYIPTEEINKLDKTVQNEPFLALDGGIDGMDIYRKIFIQSKQILKDKGLLLLEIGFDELDKIIKIIEHDKNYELVESVKDLGGNDRVIVCRFLQI